MRFLFPERIQEVLCVSVFPSNFASEDFLQNLLPPRFSFQVRTTQELIEIRATCHPSVSPPRGQGQVQTHPFWKRENHLRASSLGLGILGSAGPEELASLSLPGMALPVQHQPELSREPHPPGAAMVLRTTATTTTLVVKMIAADDTDTRACPSCFRNIKSFKPHHISKRWVLSLSSFYKWGN